MKIFRRVRRQYAIVGIRSQQQSTKFSLINRRILFGFLIFGCTAISQFMYMFRVASGFMAYIEGICWTSGNIIVSICFTTIAFKRNLLFDSINKFERFIHSRHKHPKSRKFFIKTNYRVERFCKIVFKVLVKIALQFALIPTFIASFATYFLTDMGKDALQLPIPLWFPFESNNPIGYLIAFILEYIMVAYEYFLDATTLSLGIAAYLSTISSTKEVQRILHSINKKLNTNQKRSSEFECLFSEYVRAHAAIKQVQHDFSDIFQPIIMSLFTWSLLAISGALLIIQVEILHHGNVMPLVVLILNGVIAFATVFIACEIGHRMADAFDKINFDIEQFDWYLLPIEIKRDLPMIMLIAQQPVSLACFGDINCARDVFKSVIHCAFSYFMVLRQLNI